MSCAELPDKHKVPLVDDDDAVRTMMNATLEQRGFDVVAVASVTEALRRITSKTFDILITDLSSVPLSDNERTGHLAGPTGLAQAESQIFHHLERACGWEWRIAVTTVKPSPGSGLCRCSLAATPTAATPTCKALRLRRSENDCENWNIRAGVQGPLPRNFRASSASNRDSCLRLSVQKDFER